MTDAGPYDKPLPFAVDISFNGITWLKRQEHGNHFAATREARELSMKAKYPLVCYTRVVNVLLGVTTVTYKAGRSVEPS